LFLGDGTSSVVRQPPDGRRAKSKTNFYGKKYLNWAFAGAYEGFSVEFERPVFIIFNILSFLALFCYILAINICFCKGLSSFPLVLLAFGILLGIINLLALLSYKQKVNFNFLVISLIIICGFIFEIHPVRLKQLSQKLNSPILRDKFRAT
jgi:hypothetical protein